MQMDIESYDNASSQMYFLIFQPINELSPTVYELELISSNCYKLGTQFHKYTMYQYSGTFDDVMARCQQ